MNDTDSRLIDGSDVDRPERLSLRTRLAWKVGEIVIVAVASVLMVARCGPNILCFVLGAVLLGGAFASGVGAFIRRPLLRRKVSLVLVAIMASAAVAYAFYASAPTTLFRRYVADPVPASVRILESEYQGGMDPAVYLCFELTPGDLEAILRTRAYSIVSEMQGPIGQPPPAWWQPQSLANPTMYHWESRWEDEPDTSRNDARLWVDETKTKAYFTYWVY